MKAIIFDIDGTLANCNHRRHFVEGKNKDFDAFYDAMGADEPNGLIVEMCNVYARYINYKIIICTGRPDTYRKTTEEWLERCGVQYHELHMRPAALRFDSDVLIKQDMLDDIKLRDNVVMAVDDRTQVVQMWRRNGILCMQVDEGNF